MNHLRPAGAVARTGVVAALAAVAVALSGCGSPAPVTPAPEPASPSSATTPTAPVTPSATAPSTPVSRAPVTPVTAPAPGNGSTEDRAAAETVFRTYLRAVADGEFATACTLNAPETNQRLLDELARRGTPAPTCEAAIATLYAGSGVAQGAATIADTLSVERVDVDGDAATVAWSVEVAGKRPVITNALRRVDGQWRLLPTPDPAG
jgi:predicted lipid-binding transport protein (Tim44 family)